MERRIRGNALGSNKKVIGIAILFGICIYGLCMLSIFTSLFSGYYFYSHPKALSEDLLPERVRESIPILIRKEVDHGDYSGRVVHVIPHSHCDPGWLKTFQGYYDADVSKILTNVVHELKKNPLRRFVWAEISFFSLWWREQTLETKLTVKQMVANKQLEFVEGGWVQPDEANPDVQAILMQLEEGHRFLLHEFGIKPRIGWQIDPFGHSSINPSVFSMLGYDAMVINRIHYNLKGLFTREKHMEFVWRGSSATGEHSEMLTHVLHSHYSAPRGFDFEEGNHVSASNVKAKAKQYARLMEDRFRAYRSQHVMVVHGDDFKFKNAKIQFDQLDILFEEINSHPEQYGFRVQYSTPRTYFKALHRSKVEVPFYQGDFFPYADNPTSYWTGYYSSRPLHKGMSRDMESLIAAGESLLAHALGRGGEKAMREIPYGDYYQKVVDGRRDVALFQHHDGITGTARTHVAKDYLERLELTASRLEQVVGGVIQYLLLGHIDLDRTSVRSVPVRHGAFDWKEGIRIAGDGGKVLAVYNPLGWKSKEYLKVGLWAEDPEALTVLNSRREVLPCQVDQVYDGNMVAVEHSYQLICEMVVEAMGVEAVWVGKGEKAGNIVKSEVKTLNLESSLQNGVIEVGLDGRGFVKQVKGEQVRKLHLGIFHYETVNSGAYIFRSKGDAKEVQGSVMGQVLKGVLSESSWACLHSPVVNEYCVENRVYKGDSKDPYDIYGDMVEVSHRVSPKVNQEVAIRVQSEINSEGTFYTDNGMEMVKRAASRLSYVPNRLNRLPEVNYVPSIRGAFMRDGQDGMEVSVVNRQSMGCALIKEGVLEFMIHRSLGKDDGRGMNQALIDDTIVQHLQWIRVNRVREVEHKRPLMEVKLNHPLVVMSYDAKGMAWEGDKGRYKALQQPFPWNLYVTLKPLYPHTTDVGVRVHHIYDDDEDTALKVKDLLSREGVADLSLLDYQGFGVTWMTPTLMYMEADKEDGRMSWDAGIGQMDLTKVNWNAVDANIQSQNTDESGVFISKAAIDMQKQEEERKRKRAEREMLAVGDKAGEHSMQLPVEALRQHTGVLTFRYGTRVGAPKRLKISGLMVHKEDSHTRTKRKPVVEKVPEEDHDVHPLSPSEDGGVGMHLEKLLLFLLSVSALGILYIAYKHIK